LITKLTILSVEATLVYVKSSTENLDLNRPTYMYIVSVSYNYPSSSSPCNNPKCISMSDNSTTKFSKYAIDINNYSVILYLTQRN